jgi:hypothetical protein
MSKLEEYANYLAITKDMSEYEHLKELLLKYPHLSLKEVRRWYRLEP